MERSIPSSFLSVPFSTQEHFEIRAGFGVVPLFLFFAYTFFKVLDRVFVTRYRLFLGKCRRKTYFVKGCTASDAINGFSVLIK